MKVVKTIIWLFVKWFIIIPFAILSIPFVLIGIAGIDQITKCIACKVIK